MLLRKGKSVRYKDLHHGHTQGKMNTAHEEQAPEPAPSETEEDDLEELQRQAEALRRQEQVAQLKLTIRQSQQNIEELTKKLTYTDHVGSQPPPNPQLASPQPPAQQQTPTQPPSNQQQLPIPQPSTQQQQLGINLGEFYSNNNVNVYSADEQTQPPVNSGEYGSMPRLDLNPQSALFSPNDVRRGKHKAIVDYLPPSVRKSEPSDEHELTPSVMMSVGRRVKLDSVSPAQWMAANACILAELLRESPSVAYQLSLDYMSHTTKIGELACRYTWRSVLAYDDEYRARQFKDKFRWGSVCFHLQTVLLVPRATAREGDREADKKRRPREENKRQSVCWNWNRGEPCVRTPCSYLHVCEWCKNSSHPRINHDTHK